jgi:hypothetical protein
MATAAHLARLVEEDIAWKALTEQMAEAHARIKSLLLMPMRSRPCWRWWHSSALTGGNCPDDTPDWAR